MKHVLALLLGLLPAGAHAAPPPPPFEAPPKGPPSFFVTSVGSGRGGDLGGLEGADRHCQKLASAAGLPGGRWRAYLSTQSRPGHRAVNARDRIGRGPWFNVQGYRIAGDPADLHGDTLEAARRGNLLSRSNALTERGESYPGDHAFHDILTGTRPDGRAYTGRYDRTCSNWTSGAVGGSAQVGHSDRDSRSTGMSWNSAHESLGCSEAKLRETSGRGLFYCFEASPR